MMMNPEISESSLLLHEQELWASVLLPHQVQQAPGLRGTGHHFVRDVSQDVPRVERVRPHAHSSEISLVEAAHWFRCEHGRE